MNGFTFLIFAFASKAVEIGISYYVAKEKEKDLKKANADRDAILSRQAAALDKEKNRKLMVTARAKIGLIRSRTVTSGGSAESPHRFDNLAVASSLAGAQAFLADTSGIAKELRESASRIRGIEGETPGLAALLGAGAASIGASTFASQSASAKWDNSSSGYKTTDWASTPGPYYPSGDGLP